MPNDILRAEQRGKAAPKATRRLSLDELQILQAQAASGGVKLQRKLRLPAQDAEDMSQELLVDLLSRLADYDPDRGSLGAYAHVVMRHHASRLADRYCRHLTAQGGHALPLTVVEHLAVSPAWEAASEGLVVHQGLKGLSGADRRLCHALCQHSVATLTMAGFGSRSSIYRRIRDLRPVLTLFGLGSGWDVLARA